MELPPGFRFCPSPTELILHYVKKKNDGCKLPFEIPEFDLYKLHPENLSGNFKYAMGIEKYFFTQLEMRNPGGKRLKRTTDEGYWKDTSIGNGDLICDGKKIGYKKTFVFIEIKHKKKNKTNWIMHQFRSTHSQMSAATPTDTKKKKLDDYVLCKIYQNKPSPSSNYFTKAIEEVKTDNSSNYIPQQTVLDLQSVTFQHGSFQQNLGLEGMNTLQHVSVQQNFPNITNECEPIKESSVDPIVSMLHPNQMNSMTSGLMLDLEQIRVYSPGEFKDESNFTEAINIENDYTPMTIEEEVRTDQNIELEGMNPLQHSSIQQNSSNMHELSTASMAHPNQTNSIDNSIDWKSWCFELDITTSPSAMTDFPYEFIDESVIEYINDYMKF